MQLYFSPLACSMATRIAFHEAGATADFIQVDTKAKRLADGTDFRTINPLGQVPTLRTDDGDLLSENPAVLLYVADCYPQAGLAPAAGFERYRLLQWLNFTTSELHKQIFIPLLDRNSPDGAKSFARDKLPSRLGMLEAHLTGQDFLLGRFTIADAYLFTVLNWAQYCGVDLSPWPAITGYIARNLARPAIARAVAEETALRQAA